jgi:hypothetical protein
VALERPDVPSSLGIPEPAHAIGAAARRDLSIEAQINPEDCVPVGMDRIELTAGRCVPPAERVVCGDSGKRLPIWAEGEKMIAIRKIKKRLLQLATAQIPQTYKRVSSAAGKQLPISADRKGPDHFGVGLQRLERDAALDIPQLNSTIVASGHKDGPAHSKQQRMDLIGVAVQRMHRVWTIHMPDTYFPAHVAAGERLSIGGKCQGGDGDRMPCEGSSQLSRMDVPQQHDAI